MIELFGLIFGGVSRLAQHAMDLRDKQHERGHELAMLDKQVEMADKRHAHDAELRRMDVAAAETAADFAGLQAAIEAQARESTAAGGWVAALSASIRPLLTLWHVVVIYTAVKLALAVIAWRGGMSVADAMVFVYGPEDRALCFSMASFWFADRALRRRFGA